MEGDPPIYMYIYVYVYGYIYIYIVPASDLKQKQYFPNLGCHYTIKPSTNLISNVAFLKTGRTIGDMADFEMHFGVLWCLMF